MRQWFSPSKIIDLDLPGMPKAKDKLIAKAKREGWKSRPRKGRGGGEEYHFSKFPPEAQEQLFKGHLSDNVAEAAQAAEYSDIQHAAPKDIRAAARIEIIRLFEAYLRDTGCSIVKAEPSFILLYQADCRKPAPEFVPKWIADVYPAVGIRTLRGWRAKKRLAKSHEDMADRYKRGHKRCVLETSHQGAVKNTIIALLKNHRLKAGHIRDTVIAHFGPCAEIKDAKTGQTLERPWPKIRGFERYIADLKTRNKALLLHITDPDAYKSKYMPAFGDASAGIVRLNQLWEIDASPADVLLNDGRYSVYACIDVYSRRTVFTVSKTASTDASLLVVRKAIQSWGVPETIKTDNGSDFKSFRFRNALTNLSIEHKTCRPFSPEKKPHVERVIGTMQRDLMVRLPGFVGHNVADRKKIEARKTFADRMGEGDAETFKVNLSASELQTLLDQWALNAYGEKKHSTTGETPNARAHGWAGQIKTIANERALDILLAPIASGGGWREVSKKGVRIDKITFSAPEFSTLIGQRVFVKHDPLDMGKVYIFSKDNAFICTALNVNFLGTEREEHARASKRRANSLRAEERRRVREAEKAITPEVILNDVLREKAEADPNVVTFRPSTEHTSHGLEQAAKATRGYDPNASAQRTPEEEESYRQFLESFEAPKTNTVVPFNEEQARFERALRLEQRLATESRISEDDNRWLVNYQKTSEYIANQERQRHLGDFYNRKTPNRSPDP